jgi:polysaccharide pyruvyl transferase WcaK-like protein
MTPPAEARPADERWITRMATQPTLRLLKSPARRSPAAARRASRESAVAQSGHKPLKVSFFGHFGSSNSGNESTLLSILARLRALSPESEFRCICTNPETVAARDGIEAVPITTRAARIWDRDVPLLQRAATAFVGVAGEVGQYARAFRSLKSTDMLIVPGTGLLTDAYGLSHWGPYSMFKWVLMAKLRGAKVLFVSVGAGPIDSVPGRLLVKAALSLADYRSYRDHASKEYLERIGFDASEDPVYPDLVFGLPDGWLTTRAVRPHGARRVVGLGLMVYAGKYSTLHPRDETYDAYLESLAVFTAWLLDHDYDIRLLLGDADTDVIAEFRSVLASQGSYDRDRLVEQPIASVHDVLSELAATDVVVATRFHNVLLSLLLNKPVIAITFHHKCSSLMHEMTLSEYCHDIDEMNADRLIAQFEELERNSESVKHAIEQAVDGARIALEDQYEHLFASA